MIGALNVVRSGRTSVLLLLVTALAGCGSGSDDTSQASSTSTVGGKVTGLDGVITLTNNGDNRLILNTDTAYIFSREIIRGAAYQVAVDEKPDHQICTVSNGSGIANDNVNNADIHCTTPPQYSVGGTVTGLSGLLKLRNNGGDDITLNANGNYTFPTTIMSSTGYQVTVYDEPVNQDCTVTNGVGTISANVVNVNVSCTLPDAWAHPANLAAQLTSPLGQDQINPQVVMDGNGNAIVVWMQSDGANTQIFKSEYRGGTWTHPANLADNISPDGTDVFSPRVAMGRNGAADDAVIVWAQWDSASLMVRKTQIFMSEYRLGGWTHPATIASSINPAGSQAFNDPAVAMDDNGNTIVVWRQLDGPTPTIDFPQLYMREYRAGVWSTLTGLTDRFSQPSNEVRFPPDVAMDNNGNAVVVWRQYSGGGTGKFLVYMREYRLGAWSAVPNVGSDSISPAGSSGLTGPQVEMDNSGNTIIVWDQANPEPQPHPYFPGVNPVEIMQIFKREYRSGVWGTPLVGLTDNISPDGLHATNPKVAMDDNGNAIITWLQSDANAPQLFKSEYRLSAWTHPATLADNISPDNEGVVNSDLAMDNNGNAIIAWRQFDGTKDMTYKSEYRNSAWRHPVSLLDAINPGISASVLTGPDVAMDNTGDALILWSQSNAEAAPIFQQTFMSELR